MKAPAPISVKSEIKNWCGPPVFNQLGQWDIDGALSAWEGCAIASWWAMGWREANGIESKLSESWTYQLSEQL